MPGDAVWCTVCGKRITLTVEGVLRQHGHPARRCKGSGTTSYSYAKPDGT